MSSTDTTFASGRYSKRKRTQVKYFLSELDVSDCESELETHKTKKPKSKATTRPLPPKATFHFLSLPAELRTLIATHALTSPCGINLVATFKHRRRTVEHISPACQAKVSANTWATSARINNSTRAAYDAPQPLVPALLALNKQVYSETRDVLYGGNEFVFADSFALYNFLINLGPSAAGRLRRVRLLGWGHGRAMRVYNHACFAVLVWATNLSSLHIDAQMGGYRAVNDGAEQFYRDAFPWLEAVGVAKGEVDAAVEVLRFGGKAFVAKSWVDGVAVVDLETRTEAFKDALRELLGAQQKRIMAPSATKKRKVARLDEL